MEALRDLKWVGGARVMQMARGPFHSGMEGPYCPGGFDERLQVERVFWAFIPHVNTIYGVSDAHDLLQHAGVSSPLRRAASSLAPVYEETVADHLRAVPGQQEAQSTSSPVIAKLKRVMPPLNRAEQGMQQLFRGKKAKLVAKPPPAAAAAAGDTEQPGQETTAMEAAAAIMEAAAMEAAATEPL